MSLKLFIFAIQCQGESCWRFCSVQFLTSVLNVYFNYLQHAWILKRVAILGSNRIDFKKGNDLNLTTSEEISSSQCDYLLKTSLLFCNSSFPRSIGTYRVCTFQSTSHFARKSQYWASLIKWRVRTPLQWTDRKEENNQCHSFFY